MASWKKPLLMLSSVSERPAQFVKRETMWDLQKRLVQNKGTVVNPEMNPDVGPMLRDVFGNVIIYDYFIRGGFFYMISTYWSEGSPKLKVLVNDVEVKEYGYQEYMSTRYFACPSPDTGIVWVTINGVKYELMPDIIKPLSKKHKFGIVLNFKYESPAWIRRFLEYYRGQGADAFYFYYNGPVIPSGLPVADDIKYRVWDCPFKIHSNRFIHSAQTVAYCSFRWRHYDDCEWVAAIDFDEFIYDIQEKGRVINLLDNMNCDVVMIENYWASVSSLGGPITYSLKSSGFAFDNGRTKCIFNTKKYRGEWGIHLPKASCLMIKSRRLIFFHIIDCLHPERTGLLASPNAKTASLKITPLV